jgi:hypothetical protein
MALVKLSLYLTKQYAMKAYGGVDVYRSTFSWPRYYFEVSGHLHAPAALPPGNELSIPIA